MVVRAGRDASHASHRSDLSVLPFSMPPSDVIPGPYRAPHPVRRDPVRPDLAPNYRAAWRDRTWRRSLLILAYGLWIALFGVAADLMPRGDASLPALITFLALVTWTIPLVAATSYLLAFRCPRCERRFYGEDLLFGTQSEVGRSCRNCGLRTREESE